MQGYAGSKSTTELEVARAVWLAATDGSERLRYAAGQDAGSSPSCAARSR
jgi:hypothetical protein